MGSMLPNQFSGAQMGLAERLQLIGDVPAATAILDRFLQHATIINITGKSYRLRHGGQSGVPEKAKGRRSTAGDEGCSPPEDTVADKPLSSDVGLSADQTA